MAALIDQSLAEQILEKRLRGERLSLEDGVLLFHANLTLLGQAAHAVRCAMHPEPVVTFVIDRNVATTNACIVDCDFCAFYVSPKSEKKYVTEFDEIFRNLDALTDIGGTQVLFQGGINPELRLGHYLNLFRTVKERYPSLHIHSLSPEEIHYLTKRERLTAEEVLGELKAAGLNSLPGGGAEILVDRVRSTISPKKIPASRWLEIMRAAYNVGLKGTATMMYGHIETLEERVIHFLKLRELQDDTGVFRAFIPWSFSAPNTPRMSHIPMAGGEDYLRTMAVSRLVIDNIPNFQTGWVTEGTKLAQVALAYGANDMGGILMEERVVKATGIVHDTSREEFLNLIRKAGYRAAQRDTNYEIVRYF
ncbi:MAG: dehypoxanthine futalosine cyclase [Candidatus Omnitrophica bacterium]|nr:dehypoxanthine futalosine cyclase [Candidatus Omnitrophota bacterium]